MPNIYSQDLRKLVLEKISEGISRIKISKQFKIQQEQYIGGKFVIKKKVIIFQGK